MHRAHTHRHTQSVGEGAKQEAISAPMADAANALRWGFRIFQLTLLCASAFPSALPTSLLQHRIELLQDGAGTVFYKLVSLDKVEKLRGLSPADMLVYQLIEKSSNLGIWIKDLRRKSNLSALEIPKILKELLKRRLIKCEKSVAATNKKVYMLYEIEPAREVSGGAWYDKATGEFDREYMAALETTVMHFLERKSKQRDAERERAASKIGYAAASSSAASPSLDSAFASPSDVERYLKETGAFKTVPSAEETNKILAGLVYEGRVERKEDEAGGWEREEAAEAAAASSSAAADEDRPLAAARRRRRDEVSYVYRFVRAGVFQSSFAQIPCATCPVARNCAEGNPISPQTCEYLAQWLQF